MNIKCKQPLENGRFILLKKSSNLTEKQTVKLSKLLKMNLSSIKAYLMKEDFQRFWQYKKAGWADKFLEDWAERTMQSNVGPMKKVAKIISKKLPLQQNLWVHGGSFNFPSW